MMRRTLAGLVGLLVLGASCSRDSSEARGEATLVPLGSVALVRGDETVSVSEPLTIVSGDLLRSGFDGGARIEWADGQSLEIAPDTQLEFDPFLPELVSGSALIQSADGLAISAGSARVEGHDGIFRLDRDVSLRVGVYEGVATVPGSGWDDQIGALSEAFVNPFAGTVADDPEPLEVSPDDPWDARLLGAAMDVGLRLADLQRGLAAQVRGRRDVVVSVLEGDFRRSELERLVARVPAGDLVVAAQAAILAAELHGLTASAVLEEILAFRADGAAWPLVVAQWGLERAALLAAVARVSEAIADRLRQPARSRPGDGFGASPDPGGPGSPGPGGGGGGATPPSGGGDPPGDDPPANDPPGNDPPGNDPPGNDPPTEPECSGTVDCLVDDVIGVTTDALSP